ncbi:EamA family transporter [Sporosarcina thermotolerans]|uniref:EamA family transporter n=1 Tax=Sporosarcina thermotolerans TaxID=633404 RepID=UPI0024BC7247|nr:EamA family transporter [Sporosarcina thermotolerans]WHT48119.1 EamA family transporter [Sporosarcina thermotolerans]
MKFNKGIVFVLLGAACFGFTPIFAKLGFSYGYSLGQITIAQMLISFILIWSITLFRRSSFKGLTKKNILQIMMTGCFIGLTTVFYYASMQYLPASLAIILMFQFIWIGIILEWIFSKVTPAPVTILSILLILVGSFSLRISLTETFRGFRLKVLYSVFFLRSRMQVLFSSVEKWRSMWMR